MPSGVYTKTEEHKQKCREACRTPAARERSRVTGRAMGKARAGVPQSVEHRQKLRAVHITPEALERSRACTGDKSHNWKGGISFELYPPEFDKAKQQIRERDGNICQRCGRTREEEGRELAVHHIDYNKQNCNDDNLITLCNSCNGKVNSNRDYWKQVFQQKLELQLV